MSGQRTIRSAKSHIGGAAVAPLTASPPLGAGGLADASGLCWSPSPYPQSLPRLGRTPLVVRSSLGGVIPTKDTPCRMTQPLTIEDLLTKLNPQQREAAIHGDSPLLIVAGPAPARPPRLCTASPG